MIWIYGLIDMAKMDETMIVFAHFHNLSYFVLAVCSMHKPFKAEIYPSLVAGALNL